MKAVLLFPGQGSQFEGMGRTCLDNFATARHCIEEASDTLQRDFKKLLCEATDNELAQTTNTQPALLVIETAICRVLQQEGLQIQAALGHSVGEYAALVSTQALPFAQALKAVQHRAQWMQEAVPLGEGGMLAVMGLSDTQVQLLCKQAQRNTEGNKGPQQQVLEPANFNAPGQVVISGHKTQIQNLLQQGVTNKTELLQSLGLEAGHKLRFIELKVSAPFHCSLMQGVEDKMRPVLEACHWQDATAPVLQNVVAQSVQKAASLCENLVQQISRPVLWAQSMNYLKEQNLTLAIECGPGRVLAGLAKKNIGPQLQVRATHSLDDFKALL